MREIKTAAGNWVWEPTEAQKKRVLSQHPRMLTEQDANGRTMYLVHQRSVLCPSPAMRNGKYPPSGEKAGRWFVPLTECKKCVHYGEGWPSRAIRNVRCEWRGPQARKES